MLQYAEKSGWESVHVDQDEEQVADRVISNMMRAAMCVLHTVEWF
ncbi:hypothetical protein [Streptomyces sp. DH10]|nr:hypothetical protein [Streptomyces sp. DH10]MDG9712639.1 hypothetical protein [Streptomyces sp. DH10]